MERVKWTDDRLDERFTLIDETFERIFDELRGIRSDLARLQDRLVQVGVALVGALLAQTTALTIALVA